MKVSDVGLQANAAGDESDRAARGVRGRRSIWPANPAVRSLTVCSVIQSPGWTWSPTRYECSFSCSAMKRTISVIPICPPKMRTPWKNAENVRTRDGEPRRAGEERLQDDRGDEPDERERLADCHQQLGPEVVLGRPRAGQIARSSGTRVPMTANPHRHQQAGIETLVQQVGREERETQLRHRRPQHGRTELRGVETRARPASAG